MSMRYLVMSAAVDSARKRCSCGSSKWQNLSTKCLNLKCGCFKAGVHCMHGRCKCKGCENNPYDLAYEGGKGCTCKSNKCKIMTCGCRERGARCTLECSCQGCENGKGTGGESADKSNAGPGGQGGTISSGEAVEPSSKRPKLKELLPSSVVVHTRSYAYILAANDFSLINFRNFLVVFVIQTGMRRQRGPGGIVSALRYIFS
ncbi:hypothetical protein CFC21_004414 [Triticum aestivum]|uniref:CRC domain-containing protein n=3 Tax=Triticum TaxID=4564 RepID=A0A9R0V0L4_TRITD|nr:hypothetical protein CFC21_004414 [Triticum aestivum]VAH11467.1 unnamed protein product [Triticum turgidum subsp. durum]